VKFKFSASDDGTTSSIEFEAELLPDVLEWFHQFLRGAGYFPPGSHLTFDDDDPPPVDRCT